MCSFITSVDNLIASSDDKLADRFDLGVEVDIS
jgi:hypothetical protein